MITPDEKIFTVKNKYIALELMNTEGHALIDARIDNENPYKINFIFKDDELVRKDFFMIVDRRKKENEVMRTKTHVLNKDETDAVIDILQNKISELNNLDPTSMTIETIIEKLK